MGYVGALPNESGALFRGHLNSAQQEIARLFAGATAPDPTYAHQFWFDTGTSLIKRRNATNTAWATVGTFAADGSVAWYYGGVALGAGATAKANFAATAAPGVGDDSADGYSAGSLWLNATAGAAYICRSAALGAADWRAITTTTFAADTAGLVPGPTAADVTAVRLLSAAGTWVNPEWAALQTLAPPTAGGAIDLTSGSPGDFRRLRVRADGLALTASAALTLQLRLGGSWKTTSTDYDWTGTYVTDGSQVQTGATAGSVPLSYSGWAATGEIGAEIMVTTQGSRPIIRARGAYSFTGGRVLFDLDGYCNFTGSVDGVRIGAGAGTYTAAGRVIMEGGLT